jgi:hypothetical protein
MINIFQLDLDSVVSAPHYEQSPDYFYHEESKDLTLSQNGGAEPKVKPISDFED